MANLEVQIGADNSELNKKIKEAEVNLKELSNIKLQQIKLGLDTKEITGNIKSVKSELASLKTISKDTGNAISGMAPKVANGSNALMQFSRIAQDAPFGIIGIGNNITATTEAFGYLKAQTGSTGGALKALGSSIMGSGGILLAVSLLTTGLTYLSQSGLTVGDIFDKITGNFDEFGNAIKKASEEGVKATSGEVFGLKALVAASQNKALSDKDRLIAVDNLQKQYPGYFGNLSKEEIMTSNLTSVVNELTTALVNRAIAEKLAGASADMQLKVFAANAKLVKQKNETSKLEAKLEKDLASAKLSNANSAAQLAIITAKGTNAINASKDAENEYRQEILSGTKALERRQNVINQLTASSLKLDQKTPAKAKAAKKAKVNPNAGNEFNPFLNDFSSRVIPEIALTFKDPTSGFMDWNASVVAGLTTTEKALLDFNNRASQIINGALIDTFSGIGSALGNALASGGNVLSAIGSTLLDSLGGVLTSMGKMAIEIGIGLLGIKLALKTLNPYAAIAAGVGLVALGAIFSSKSKAIGNSMGGSGGSASSSTGSGANNNSFSSGGFSSASSNGGTVVFEIAGQKLIGVLSNTLNANKRLGGQNSLIIG